MFNHCLLSKKITQTNGVLQGNPISPVLFNIMTADITDITRDSSTSLIMYADDMVLGSANKEELQQTLYKLEKWATANSLKINHQKTKQMTFRKGGRTSEKDKLTLLGKPLEVVPQFTYLGITLQTTLRSFRIHVQQKVTAAIKAIYSMRYLHQLAMKTAITLFKAVITPIATYGISLMWEKLQARDLAQIESVKARFMKRVMGVGKTAPSRMAYLLMRETFFVEDIRRQLLLPNTCAYQNTLDELRKKRNDICREFYETEAMRTNEWTQPNYEMRHILTRYAIHGFHHKICRTKKFHEPSEDCLCELCDGVCERYHAEKCKNRHVSLRKFCAD